MRPVRSRLTIVLCVILAVLDVVPARGAAAISTVARAGPPRRTLSWHSTGDSYSSGEGVSGNKGDCAQSDKAYGPLAASKLLSAKWTIVPVVFTACTGHLVEDFLNRYPGGDSKGSMIEWSEEQGLEGGRSDVLTLSFGGNDIGFADVVKDCTPASDWVVGGLVGGCDDAEDDLRARIDALVSPTRQCTGGRHGDRRDDSFGWDCDLLLDDRGTPGPSDDRRGSIVDFYRLLVDEHLTANGRLYVVGYPALFAPIQDWRAWNAFGCASVRWGDAEKLSRLSEHFNAKLREAVQLADEGRGRIVYLSRYDLFRAGSHELCGTGQDWINALSTNRGPGLGSPRIEGSFHVNGAGHQATAVKLAELVKSTDWDAVTEAELLNLTLPGSICGALELPPGDHRLRNGSFTVEAGSNMERGIHIGDTAVGDLDGDGSADGAFTLMCANGVADHTDIVFVLRASDRRLIDVTLTRDQPELDPFDQRQENLADATEVRIANGRLQVDMAWTFMNDARCCPTAEATGYYTLDGDEARRVDLDLENDQTRTAALAEAVSSGDRSRVAALVAPGEVDLWDEFMDRGDRFRGGECVVKDILDDFRYCRLEPDPAAYQVVVEWVDAVTGTVGDRRASIIVGGDL